MRPRPRAGARWCSRPRSPKPRSPSRACASSSTAGLRACRATSPTSALTRLETVRVSRAAADQRRGRAGRTEPGVCYRLWDEPQTASLEAYARPEILAADLSSLLLDLAQWGAADPATLAFLDPPPAGALTEARALLVELGAIDAQGRITDEGRKLRRLPLPPRLARMVVDAARAGRGPARRRHRRDPVGARARRRRCRPVASSRPVPPRPLAARRGCAAHGEALGGRCRGRRGQKHSGEIRSVGRRHSLARLSGPHRQDPRRQRRVPARQRPRRQHRSRLGAFARAVSGGRRTVGHRGAGPHSAGRARSRSTRSKRVSPTGSRTARRSPSTRRRRACAAAAANGSARSRSPSGRSRPAPRRMPPASSPKASCGSASTGCPGASRCNSGATG